MYIHFNDFSVIIACDTDDAQSCSCGTLICSSDSTAREMLIDHACFFAEHSSAKTKPCLLLLESSKGRIVAEGNKRILTGLPSGWDKKESSVDLSFMKDCDPTSVVAVRIKGDISEILSQLNDINFLEENE